VATISSLQAIIRTLIWSGFAVGMLALIAFVVVSWYITDTNQRLRRLADELKEWRLQFDERLPKRQV
jgi:hypothetical protein